MVQICYCFVDQLVNMCLHMVGNWMHQNSCNLQSQNDAHIHYVYTGPIGRDNIY